MRFACGDASSGRSIRYEEAYAAKHPASVLVYTNPASGFSAVSGEVAAILRKAGHKPSPRGAPGLSKPRRRAPSTSRSQTSPTSTPWRPR